LAYLGDPREAEEAAHVAFIKAYGALSRFRSDASFGTWLFRIGINHCKDVLKARGRNRFLSLDAMLEGPDGSGSGRVPEGLVQAAPKDDSETAARLKDAMGRLSAGEREVLLKVADRSEEDYGAIGQEMGLSREGVKGRLKRARAKVIGYLKKHGG
jgi:RNA polymerase sigma-70 factor (ECF subfamily)